MQDSKLSYSDFYALKLNFLRLCIRLEKAKNGMFSVLTVFPFCKLSCQGLFHVPQCRHIYLVSFHSNVLAVFLKIINIFITIIKIIETTLKPQHFFFNLTRIFGSNVAKRLRPKSYLCFSCLCIF